ncbi:MAG TPA: tRNA (adenosine(37)-N6)-dimethylallyltransferase MiaA, partial [Methylophilaceae bacterium]|nr:tRNA (adenosine(37)-N6)-dimethylallyltransferase MiaA [Methylophilaceae bacterium]
LINGLINEVESILAKYPSLTIESTSMRCVGYRQVLKYLAGEYDYEELSNRGVYATRQLAKRQLTWLRGMPDIQVIDPLLPTYIDGIKNILNQLDK